MLNAINATLAPNTVSCAYRNGWPITDEHRAYCTANGHSEFVIAGTVQDECGVCGELREAAPVLPVEATYLNASGGCFTDTATTVRVTIDRNGKPRADVRVKLHDHTLRWWDCPSADRIRGFVDETLAGLNLHRVGRRFDMPTTGSIVNMAHYVFDLEAD